jgi:hypothetical protein
MMPYSVSIIGGQPAELATDPGLLEQANLEDLRRDLGPSIGGALQRPAPQAQHIPEGCTGVVLLPEEADQLVRGAADHTVAFVVADAAVELHAVDGAVLVPGELGIAHLGHDDLHLEGLELPREHVAHRLGISVCERLAAHVVPAVGVALHVGVAHTDLPQLVELAELAHARKRDPVVDLADLRQRRGVLGHEDDAVVVLERNAGLAAADALARVLGLVLHHLLGRNVEGHAHAAPPAPRRPMMVS